MILTLNRLTAAMFPFKHQRYCSLKVVKILIAGCAFIGIVWLVILCFMDFSFIIQLLDQLYIPLSFGSIVLVTSVLTYCVIFRKLVKTSRQLTSNNSSTNTKVLKVLLLINFTYISFVIVPNIVFAFFTMKNIEEYFTSGAGAVSGYLRMLNYISDPLIYIYFIPIIRKRLKNDIKNIFIIKASHRSRTYVIPSREHHDEENFENQETSVNSTV